jgi:hypothetical protein
VVESGAAAIGSALSATATFTGAGGTDVAAVELFAEAVAVARTSAAPSA